MNEIRKAHVVAIVCSSLLSHLALDLQVDRVIRLETDAIDNPTTFDRVPTYWLPTIRSLGVNVPVILIGNKIDLRDGVVTNQALEDGESALRYSSCLMFDLRRASSLTEIVPIMQEYKEVEVSFSPRSSRFTTPQLNPIVSMPVDLRRMFRSPTAKHFRSILFRPKRCPPPNRASLRHTFAFSQALLRFRPLANLPPDRYRQRWFTLL